MLFRNVNRVKKLRIRSTDMYNGIKSETVRRLLLQQNCIEKLTATKCWTFFMKWILYRRTHMKPMMKYIRSQSFEMSSIKWFIKIHDYI